MKDLSKVMIHIMDKRKALTKDLLKALEDANPEAVLLNKALEEVKGIEDFVYSVLDKRLRLDMPLKPSDDDTPPQIRLVK